MSSDRWLTYDDGAVELGMTRESFRARARREKWRKQTNNEGKTMVLVPAGAIPAPSTIVLQAPPPPTARQPEPDLVSEYVARIADLEARLEELRPALEGERAERHSERGRADHIAGELADVARQFADAMAAAQGMINAERARADAAEKDAKRIAERLREAEDHVLEVDAFTQAPRWKQAAMRRPPRLLGMFTPLSLIKAWTRTAA